jgi:hypothetical protein
VGPTVSEGEGEKRVPVRVQSVGPQAESGAGPKGSPGVLLYFYLFASFSFSGFPISFVSFAKRLQINSNHFQGFSKIQSIKVGQ